MSVFFAQSTQAEVDVFLALLSAFKTRAWFKSCCSADHVCFLCSKIRKNSKNKACFSASSLGCQSGFCSINVHKPLLMSVCLLKIRISTDGCFLFFSAFLTWALLKYLPRWVRICFSAQMGNLGIYVFLPLPSAL